MIARIAYFENLSDVQKAAQTDNFERRFKAALTSQPGLIALYHMSAPDGTRISLTIWESQGAAMAGGQRANAVPLLPGQVATDIPSPSKAEILEVLSAVVVPPSG